VGLGAGACVGVGDGTAVLLGVADGDGVFVAVGEVTGVLVAVGGTEVALGVEVGGTEVALGVEVGGAGVLVGTGLDDVPIVRTAKPYPGRETVGDVETGSVCVTGPVVTLVVASICCKDTDVGEIPCRFTVTVAAMPVPPFVVVLLTWRSTTNTATVPSGR
jgi:hypothetical protein